MADEITVPINFRAPKALRKAVARVCVTRGITRGALWVEAMRLYLWGEEAARKRGLVLASTDDDLKKAGLV